MPLASEDEAGEETDMSLITGGLRQQGLARAQAPSLEPSSLVLRNQALTVANTNTAGTGGKPLDQPMLCCVQQHYGDAFFLKKCKKCVVLVTVLPCSLPFMIKMLPW